MKHLLIAVSLVLLAGLIGASVHAVDCPSEYSECTNVPGKSCRLETGAACAITDLGVTSCERPGADFVCDDCQSVGKKNCDCTTRLQLECCPGDCGEPEVCGSCEAQDGSQTLICIGIASSGTCAPHYCTGQGVGCLWNGLGSCGSGGCCSYTCGQSIPSCTGVDPCPDNVCPSSCQ